MDLPSLYTPDLSLFCGDLLPAEIISAGGSMVLDDNLKSLVLDGVQHSADESWSTMKSTLDDITTLDAHDSGLGEELFGDSWLDTKIDLLDLVEDPEDFQPVAMSMVGPELVVIKPESSSAALEVLQSMAEATCQMLASEESSINGVDEDPNPTVVPDIKSMGLMDLLTTEFVNNTVLEPELDWGLLNDSILSPVTAEDVESILSSGPSSPVSLVLPGETTAASLLSQMEVDNPVEESVIEESLVSSDSFIDIVEESQSSQSISDEEWVAPEIGKSRRSRQRQAPYEKPPAKIPDRKQRKKQQNKDAATRYRQKKKAEQDSINGECDGLEERNAELREKVDQMTREIQYLKDLMADVYRAKGIIIPKAK